MRTCNRFGGWNALIEALEQFDDEACNRLFIKMYLQGACQEGGCFKPKLYAESCLLKGVTTVEGQGRRLRRRVDHLLTMEMALSRRVLEGLPSACPAGIMHPAVSARLRSSVG